MCKKMAKIDGRDAERQQCLAKNIRNVFVAEKTSNRHVVSFWKNEKMEKRSGRMGGVLKLFGRTKNRKNEC